MAALTRRSFLAATAAFAQQRPRPNILLLLADNWAYPHASAYGDPVVRTPTFDRIAREGVVFQHAFAPNPSCSPSRSSLLTGQETHRLKEAANLYGPLRREFPTYTQQLAAQGYFVGFCGKGWGPGKAEAGKWPNPAGAQFESFEEFFAARPKDQPFCFWFGSHDPHVPWVEGREYKRAMDPAKVRVPAYVPDHPTVRDDILNYYCEVQHFDAECGEILKRLGHEIDNTLVVMTSDNGWQIPRGLANCYDSGVRIPLAMRMLGRIPAGQKRDDFVALADLAPTFLDAGQGLFSNTRRDHMFVERERHANVRRGDLTYPVRGIRTREYLYLRNLEPDRWPAGDPEFYWAVGPYGDVDGSPTKDLLMKTKPQPYFNICMGKRPAEELYDVRNDPDQVHNLASDPKFAAVKKKLAAQVEEWMRRTGDPRAKGATDFWDKVPYTGKKL